MRGGVACLDMVLEGFREQEKCWSLESRKPLAPAKVESTLESRVELRRMSSPIKGLKIFLR